MKPNQVLRQVARFALVAAIAGAALQAEARVEGVWGSYNSGDQERIFNLNAGAGHIAMADGVSVYMWGYGACASPCTASDAEVMQYTGPTLLARAGDHVIVNLRNNLPVTTSIMFPGQVMTNGTGPSATQPLARQVGPGESITYRFDVPQPGTYTYQSGTRTSLQIEMGMMGALVVYPAGVDPAAATGKRAYNHAATAFDRETLLVASDLDSKIHQAVFEQVGALTASGCHDNPVACEPTVDLSKRFPDYWLLNGRTSPDVFAANHVGQLPRQPYNAMPRLHPGEKILFRMVGGGTDLHPMHHHGNNSWAIARDGRMLSSNPASADTTGPDMGVSDYTIAVTPGQTYDAIWTWTGKGLKWDVFGASCDAAQPVSADNCRFGKFDSAGVQTADAACLPDPVTKLPNCAVGRYRSTQDPVTDMYKPIPTVLPSELELAYGEFYSGSPYLGDFGVRPVGAGAANTTGGFFHMFHSHNEREVVNGGIFPGGMLTMTVVEPFSVAIDPGQP